MFKALSLCLTACLLDVHWLLQTKEKLLGHTDFILELQNERQRGMRKIILEKEKLF